MKEFRTHVISYGYQTFSLKRYILVMFRTRVVSYGYKTLILKSEVGEGFGPMLFHTDIKP